MVGPATAKCNELLSLQHKFNAKLCGKKEEVASEWLKCVSLLACQPLLSGGAVSGDPHAESEDSHAQLAPNGGASAVRFGHTCMPLPLPMHKILVAHAL